MFASDDEEENNLIDFSSKPKPLPVVSRGNETKSSNLGKVNRVDPDDENKLISESNMQES